MGITDADKLAIDAAASSEYYISKDAEGNQFIELYADYRDTIEGLLQDIYEKRNDADLLSSLRETITLWYDEERFEVEDHVLRTAGFDPNSDLSEEVQEYFRENYYITAPFDHYLSQNIQINIILDGKNEANRDFVSIYEQSQALNGQLDKIDTAEALSEETSLSWLIKEQGHTMEELQTVMQDYNEFFYSENADKHGSYSDRMQTFCQSHNRFLASICQEFDNLTNYMNTLTVLASLPVKDFAEMMSEGNEVVIGNNAMLGFFCPWAGGGSMLEIELEKDLVIPREKIWDVQIEGAKFIGQYSVDNVYGLVGNAWQPPLYIRPQSMRQPEKSSLDEIIQDASTRTSDNSEPKQNISQQWNH